MDGFDGIVVGADFTVQSRDNLIVRNRISHNRHNGLELRRPGNTVTRNTANFNGNLGIDAVAGTVDGGHNKARGNGNLAQCVGISCK